MREQIHTIPVLDALKEPGACPFCKIYGNLERDSVDFLMGNAYMEEDIRDKTDEAGFCVNHLKKLNAVQNQLGLALILQTHLSKLKKPPSSLFKSSAKRLYSKILAANERCFICEKIDKTFDRYLDTFFYLWKKDNALINTLTGFCLPHYATMLQKAEQKLDKSQLEAFISNVSLIQEKNIAKIEEDLDYFIQKFDYRNADAPWKDSKDAVERTISLLKGVS
ncbi:MAG: DUF6062 family protein [Turicibacter sp.]|nr:DUF6062 family protein [Turicibacter sp.]